MHHINKKKYTLVVIGASAGGISAVGKIISGLPADFPLPVVVVQHLHPDSNDNHLVLLGKRCLLPVKEAEDKEVLRPGVVYFAPANYHLLIERDRSFSLSVDRKVSFSRPSIDVLFESAARGVGTGVIGVILTGANADGAYGLAAIKKFGGVTVVQDPETAEAAFMPEAAINAGDIDYVLPLEDMIKLLLSLTLDSNGT